MNSKLSSRHVDAADRFHSAAIHALRHVRREDSATGLSAARLSALSVLVVGGAMTMGELAAAEQVRAPTMTRIVCGLEDEGLIEREADPHDGRRVLVRATAKGKRVLWRGRERRVERLAELLGRLSAEDVARIHAAAELVEGALAQES